MAAPKIVLNDFLQRRSNEILDIGVRAILKMGRLEPTQCEELINEERKFVAGVDAVFAKLQKHVEELEKALQLKKEKEDTEKNHF